MTKENNIEPESPRPIPSMTAYIVNPDMPGGYDMEEYYDTFPLPGPKPGWSGWLVDKAWRLFRRTLPKHRFIYSNGTLREEACCK